MRFEVHSPPMEKLGPIKPSLMGQMASVAEEVVRKPRHQEPGRASWRTHVGVDPDGGMLEEFAVLVGERYLGRAPRRGAVATLSVVTDPDLFRTATRARKIAFYWHQDVLFDENNFFKRKEGPVLNIAHGVGTHSAEGHLIFDRAVQVEPNISKKDALAAGETVIGADGVLFMSQVDPSGGTIFQTEPGVYYVGNNVHKAAASSPKGRIFYQMDAWE